MQIANHKEVVLPLAVSRCCLPRALCPRQVHASHHLSQRGRALALLQGQPSELVHLTHTRHDCSLVVTANGMCPRHVPQPLLPGGPHLTRQAGVGVGQRVAEETIRVLVGLLGLSLDAVGHHGVALHDERHVVVLVRVEHGPPVVRLDHKVRRDALDVSARAGFEEAQSGERAQVHLLRLLVLILHQRQVRALVQGQEDRLLGADGAGGARAVAEQGQLAKALARLELGEELAAAGHDEALAPLPSGRDLADADPALLGGAVLGTPGLGAVRVAVRAAVAGVGPLLPPGLGVVVPLLLLGATMVALLGALLVLVALAGVNVPLPALLLGVVALLLAAGVLAALGVRALLVDFLLVQLGHLLHLDSHSAVGNDVVLAAVPGLVALDEDDLVRLEVLYLHRSGHVLLDAPVVLAEELRLQGLGNQVVNLLHLLARSLVRGLEEGLAVPKQEGLDRVALAAVHLGLLLALPNAVRRSALAGGAGGRREVVQTAAPAGDVVVNAAQHVLELALRAGPPAALGRGPLLLRAQLDPPVPGRLGHRDVLGARVARSPGAPRAHRRLLVDSP